MVECYLCEAEVAGASCTCVRGLGSLKYVCPLCVKSLVVSVVREVHAGQYESSRPCLAKCPGRQQ
jgi:hypothetical protein